jgi:MraZ protein
VAEFAGKFEHTIDAKGRMFIPADFRDELGNDFLILRYRSEECLFIMARTDHGNLAANLKKVKLPAKEAAKEQRLFYSNSFKADMDAQNRVLIPAELRKLVNLDKDVIVVGVSNRLELWNPEALNKSLEGGPNISSEASDELDNLINL